MSSAYSTRRDGPGRRVRNRKKGSHKEPAITATDRAVGVTESAAGDQSATQLVTFTIDAKTGQVIKLESLDESGERHELSDEEKANLASEGIGDKLEEIVEQAFEAGIACVLGGGERAQTQEESEQDAELRHLLLLPLIEHSMAKRLMQGDVLNRAILGTLIQHSMKAGGDTAASGSAAGLQ